MVQLNRNRIWCQDPRCQGQQALLDDSPLPVVWILGGPGSGKGTQCEKIVAKYGLVHISTGDLLRDDVKSGSKRAQMLKEIMDKGALVPNEIVLDLIKEKVQSCKGMANGFLIDGYPREASQGEAFEKNIGSPASILYMDVSEETLISRLMGRAQSSGRSDDNAETIKNRIHTFLTHNQQIMDACKGRIVKINAERPVEEIFADIEKVLDPIMEKSIAMRHSN